MVRLSEDRVVAVSRRCPHKGADLATGFVRDGEIVCPWHNLTFDPETGKSPCQVLSPLRRFNCEIHNDKVHISTDGPSETTDSTGNGDDSE